MLWHIVVWGMVSAITSPFMSFLNEDMIRLNVGYLRHGAVEFGLIACCVALFCYASKFTGKVWGNMDMFGLLNLSWLLAGGFEALATWNQKRVMKGKGLTASGKASRAKALSSGQSVVEEDEMNSMDVISGESGSIQVGGLAGFSRTSHHPISPSPRASQRILSPSPAQTILCSLLARRHSSAFPSLSPYPASPFPPHHRSIL